MEKKIGRDFFPKGTPFIRRLPLDWIVSAGCLPGKALHVGLVCWYLEGLSGNGLITLSPAKLRKFGVSRFSGYRALSALETKGLIQAQRLPGRAPIIRILSSGNAR